MTSRVSVAVFVCVFASVGLAAPADSLSPADRPLVEENRAARVFLPCRIRVVEEGSGWPVPLVELRTTHNVRFVTDNAGMIAFDLPELMGQDTWFDVHGQGYEVKPDGFGYRGVRLKPTSGESLKVLVQRTSIAKRLGRLTGAGIYGESQKLGAAFGWKETGVLGCDSVLVAEHLGRLHWVWGDTTLAKYPLGIFDSSSATDRHPLRRLEPPLRMRFDYLTGPDGSPRGVAAVPGEGPTWLSALVSLRDASGHPHLVASYSKIKPPLEAYECGLVGWDEESRIFKPLRKIWTKSETTFEAWQNPEIWEPLLAQESVPGVDSDAAVKPHTGSIAWNPWRKRWVTVFMEKFGKPSAFGELWYAEAESPTGPWGPAIKVLSHQHYTFYNPRLHPELVPDASPILLFEGTYTIQFSDGKEPTPRYEYNQVLYRIDLDDPALAKAKVPRS